MTEKIAPTEHPIHELLSKRWSPRAFAAKPVEKEVLLSLLEAARWAASAYNEQPWRFIVATKDNEGDYAKAKACFVEFNQMWAGSAPVLVLTVASDAFAHNGKPNDYAGHDVGLAVANLTVEATARGLFVHQCAGIEADKVRETYGIPEGFNPVTGLVIGYPGDGSEIPANMLQLDQAPRVRKPLGEIVFGGKWGEAAAGVA